MVKTITIDGYIGPGGYSKQFIKNELTGESDNPVTLKISSLGGSVDDALSIFDQIVSHGNVTAELSAFVASAATIISLGAKTVRMNENSFYLIHKAMSSVDEWGNMNQDEIEILIAKLESQKQQLATVTLQIAKMYAKKTCKPIDQIITLMQQQNWLTAEEAKAWGFIDEIIIPAIAENYFDNHQMVAMITANGYPDPPRKSDNPNPIPSSIDEDSFTDRIWKRLIRMQKDFNLKKTTNMKRQFTNLNNALNVDSFESSDEGIYFNEEQLLIVDQHLEANQQLVAEHDTAVTNYQNSIIALETLQSQFNAAFDVFNTIDASILAAQTSESKAQAIRDLLASKPALTPVQTLNMSDGTPSDEIDWELINALSYNKQVDINL